jgi:hypothetical protein
MRILLLALLICIIGTTRIDAQNRSDYDDFGSWNTFNLKYVLNKKVVLSYTQELRFRENLSRLNLLYSEFGAEYRFNSSIKTSLSYRWTDKFLIDNTFSFRHRLTWDVVGKVSYKKINIAFRNRIQVENRDIRVSESGKVPEWYWRKKLDISYKLNKKISPYFSTEIRYQLFDPRNVESDDTWHRIRFQGGLDYEPNKANKYGIYYMVQQEWNVPKNEGLFIFGLEYTRTIKN